jgi:hypothetical protein
MDWVHTGLVMTVDDRARDQASVRHSLVAIELQAAGVVHQHVARIGSTHILDVVEDLV